MTLRVCVFIEKVLEDYADDSLRLLNEHDIQEGDLRKVKIKDNWWHFWEIFKGIANHYSFNSLLAINRTQR